MNPFEQSLELINSTENEWTRHSRNVGKLATAFGAYISLSYQKLVILQTGAYLHDIGKSKVPSEVLYKQERLTKEEFDTVKEHPVLGYKTILASSTQGCVTFKQANSLCQDVLDIILQHHERADGRGYPYGLKAEEINPLAKIVFLCDSFDAMTSKRCYKDEFSVEYALNEIEKGLGSQFDSEYGKKFIQFIKHEGDCLNYSKNKQVI